MPLLLVARVPVYLQRVFKHTRKLKERSRKVFGGYLRTGVQFALNIAVFKLAHAIYPVFDAERLSDKSGNVLPDVYLMPAGSRLDDLARLVHTDLDKGLLYAIDVRTGLHLPTNYVLMDRDVLSIVSMVRRA